MTKGCRQNILTERELSRLTKRLALADRVIAKLRRQRRVDWRELHEPLVPWTGARR